MATAPKSRTEAFRITTPEDEHGTRTRRVVGYRAVCECGYKSRTTGSWAIAANANREHAKFHAMQPHAAVSGPT